MQLDRTDKESRVPAATQDPPEPVAQQVRPVLRVLQAKARPEQPETRARPGKAHA